MTIGNGISITVALVLFIVTSILLYVSWYVVHGRKRKGSQADSPSGEPDTETQREDKETSRKRRKNKWGYTKDDYCYPFINDIMGFEFVKVVKLKQDESPVQQTNNTEEGKRPAWEDSRGIGSLSTVSSTPVRQEAEEDEPFPENNTSVTPRNPAPYQASFKQKPTNEQEPSPEDEETDTAHFSLEDYEAAMNWGGWPDHSSGALPADDELIDKLIDENPAVLEQTNDDEQSRIAEAADAFKKALYEEEKKDYGDDIHTMLSEIDNMPEENIDIDDIDDTNIDDPPSGEDVDFNETELEIEENL